MASGPKVVLIGSRVTRPIPRLNSTTTTDKNTTNPTDKAIETINELTRLKPIALDLYHSINFN